jgi:tungstate transport system substrate-binding protein
MRLLRGCRWASLLPVFLLSCGGNAEKPVRLRLGTTTSTENSGLLDVLLPPFEKATGIPVHVIAVGSGKAMVLAENGDVDVLLVHDPEREAKFVAEGYGVSRRAVMHNDFVLVGPPSDPARIGGLRDAVQAFQLLAGARAPFFSRGDESGTHVKEKGIWKAAGVAPSSDWCRETGQGMGATLVLASEKQGYALTDRGTFAAYRAKLDLRVLCEGDPRLINPYSILAVNLERHPHVAHAAALQLIEFVTSPDGQTIIADFKPHGEPVFFPDAVGAGP